MHHRESAVTYLSGDTEQGFCEVEHGLQLPGQDLPLKTLILVPLFLPDDRYEQVALEVCVLCGSGGVAESCVGVQREILSSVSK